MKALADGGHQVAALARAQHPTGILIPSLDPNEACRKTLELLLSPDN